MTAKKAPAKAPAPERPAKAKNTPEREAEIDNGLRAWSAAQAKIDVIDANLANADLLPRDRVRLAEQRAALEADQHKARKAIAGV